MKDIYKNRFLVWLMWLIPIACTGWVGLVIWTTIQIMLCNSQTKFREEHKPPFKVTDEMIRINQNLTEEEKEYRKVLGGDCWMKLPERYGGGWVYVEKDGTYWKHLNF